MTRHPLHSNRLQRGSVLPLRVFVCVLVALGIGAAFTSAAQPAPGAGAAEPALARGRAIGAEVNLRYRTAAGRKLAVTEVTGFGPITSLTLLEDWLEPRIVRYDRALYFAICSVTAKCPYRARGIAWRADAYLPRRQGLELALRAFSETPVTLVVVSLPTREPTWAVFERADVLSHLDVAATVRELGGRPSLDAPGLRKIVLDLTRPRLYTPLPILPPPPDTMYAVPLFASSGVTIP